MGSFSSLTVTTKSFFSGAGVASRTGNRGLSFVKKTKAFNLFSKASKAKSADILDFSGKATEKGRAIGDVTDQFIASNGNSDDMLAGGSTLGDLLLKTASSEALALTSKQAVDAFESAKQSLESTTLLERSAEDLQKVEEREAFDLDRFNARRNFVSSTGDIQLVNTGGTGTTVGETTNTDPVPAVLPSKTEQKDATGAAKAALAESLGTSVNELTNKEKRAARVAAYESLGTTLKEVKAVNKEAKAAKKEAIGNARQELADALGKDIDELSKKERRQAKRTAGY